ncbi:MAG TPA: hypothetical protein VJ463_08805 [Geothrix sp.]|nr:hypothetical protein [Geothrix sp.]
MWMDAAATLFFTDVNNSAVRKMTPDGVVSTYAGIMGEQGATDGSLTQARFTLPWGLAADPAGNLFVSDIATNTIRKISPAGQVSTFAGTTGQSGNKDGNGLTASFDHPSGLACDASGSVFVADENNHTIRRISSDGVVSTFAGSPGVLGSTDGQGAAARFTYPTALAVGPSGSIYVADSGSATVRKITPAGEVSTLAGDARYPGDKDDVGSAAQFNRITGIACDSTETIYVTTASGTVRAITSTGAVSTLGGSAHVYGHRDGARAAAGFENLGPIAVGMSGSLIVGDAYCLRKISPAGEVVTLAGIPGTSGSWDGPLGVARFSGPETMAMNAAGDLFVYDAAGTIRQIKPSGLVSTVAGTPGWYGIRDGLGSTAVFYGVTALAFAPSGDMLIADTVNSAIRKMAPSGLVTTFLGYPMLPGTTDGVGLGSRFNFPSGIAVDPSGNLVVADTGNHSLRAVNTSDQVTTWAGTPGLEGHADGTLSTATFSHPRKIVRDAQGNLFVVDQMANALRKISTTGQVTSFRYGLGLNMTGPLSLDGSGNTYVVSYGPLTIKKIDATGRVSTLLSQNTVDALAPGKFPSSVAGIRDIHFASSHLYVLADNAILKVGPLP